MSEEQQMQPTPEPAAEAAPPVATEAKPEAAPEAAPKVNQPAKQPNQQNRLPQGNRPPRDARPAGSSPGGGNPGGAAPNRGAGGDRRPDSRGPRPDARGGDKGGDRRFEIQEIDLEKLISDSLYLDNQAHAVVSRVRDMDSATKTQLRRLYSAVKRAVRAPDSDRQHEFVMLRARLAYTIARHSLRSMDQIERLLLQVTRKNEARGYERFRDLFEAIVAYNE